MPVFFEMHERHADGQSFSQILTKTQTRGVVRTHAQALDRLDGPANVAQAMRDLMDDQTVEWKFPTFRVSIEIIPHYMTVIKYKDVYGLTAYAIAD